MPYAESRRLAVLQSKGLSCRPNLQLGLTCTCVPYQGAPIRCPGLAALEHEQTDTVRARARRREKWVGEPAGLAEAA